MKTLFFLLFILCNTSLFSQTTYYTTNGHNRYSEDEIKEELLKRVTDFEKAIGKKLYGNLKIEERKIIGDSIILKVSFAIDQIKKETLVDRTAFSELINKPFKNFDLKTLSGPNLKLEDVKGKPTLINFWFTRCAPCIDEIPVLNKLKDKYGHKVNFIALTYESETKVKEFLKKYPFNFTHIINAKYFIESLGLNSYPENLFLDKNGILRYVKGGIAYVENSDGEMNIGNGEDFIQIIEKLLN